VTDIEATERAVAKLVAKFGKVDIVFANAGIPGATPVGQTSLASFEEIIRTNLTAVFFTIQAAAPHLNPGASIILNGSVHAVMGVPGYSRLCRHQGRRPGHDEEPGVRIRAAPHSRESGHARWNQDTDLVGTGANRRSYGGAGKDVSGNGCSWSYG
jgi:NAD(P)-dependent dehydrogenase (short-subunit alcohol dehydrogenase family)